MQAQWHTLIPITGFTLRQQKNALLRSKEQHFPAMQVKFF